MSQCRRLFLQNKMVFTSTYRVFHRARTSFRSLHADDSLNSATPVWVGLHGIQVPELLYHIQCCANKKLLSVGMCWHGLVVQAGLQADIITANILINMYSKCGCISVAHNVFDRMPVRSMVSWNTIISAHAQNGNQKMALKLFMQMRHEETATSEFTLSSVLCACAAKSNLAECRQLHALALKKGMDSNVFVSTSMVDVYAKCNMIEEACSVFDGMPEKTSVTWSSMIAGFVQNDLYEKALALFRMAQRFDLERTKFTFSSALSACASLAAMIEGAQLHALAVQTGLDLDLFVTTTLIYVYTRCGCIEEAYMIFQNLGEKNVVVWNAMISGFSRHSRTNEVLILFEKMQQNGINPNEVTYVSVLTACGHVGLVSKGRDIFNALLKDKSVQPNVLHYSSMVDVFGRAGLIHEAWNLICQMPFKPTASIWGSLLGSCRIHGCIELAKVAAEHLFEIEPNNAGNHVLLANLYSANKRWGEAATTRKFLRETGVKKDLGKSWIEVKKSVHTFLVGDWSHPRIFEVYSKIEDLEKEMKLRAYKFQTEYDLHDVGEEEKELLLKHHSEKLALAFGLIGLPSSVPIRIHKNLRVCGDCHSFMKFSSDITKRQIILRDTNRFHHFRAGSCSCKDFW